MTLRKGNDPTLPVHYGASKLAFFVLSQSALKHIDKLFRIYYFKKIVKNHTKNRIKHINSIIAAADQKSVLIAGDSHAELLNEPKFGANNSINVGVGGVKASDYLKVLGQLNLSIRFEAIVLIIGTNDIVKWQYPGKKSTQDRFGANVRLILQNLSALSDNVFVTAVPPIGLQAKMHDPAAVEIFSLQIKMICHDQGHTFIDPFIYLRTINYGLSQSGLHPDNVHIADYLEIGKNIAILISNKINL